MPTIRPTIPTTGNGTGNGPSGLIYNTKTVQDLGAVAIGTASGSGRPGPRCCILCSRWGEAARPSSISMSAMPSRAPGRAIPAARRRGRGASQRCGCFGRRRECHLYRRLQCQPRGIVLWDHDLVDGVLGQRRPGHRSRPQHCRLRRRLAHGVRHGPGYRDDYQFVTAPVQNGSGGLKLVSASYTVFGNNGSTGNSGSVNQTEQHGLELFRQQRVDAAFRPDHGHRPLAGCRRLLVHDARRQRSVWAAS